MPDRTQKIAVWSPYMGHVGTIKAVLNLSRGFSEQGLRVDLFKIYEEWEGYEGFLASHRISIVDFGASRIFKKLPRYRAGYRFSMLVLSAYSLPCLIRYLRKEKPDYLLVCLLGFLPMLGLRFQRAKPKVILSVQGIPTFNRIRKILWNRFQAKADAVVALTPNTERLIRERTVISPERIHRIDNPVIDDAMESMAREKSGHTWFDAPDRPVLVGIGRLTRQKDFPTLMRAFSLLRGTRPCRLAILGEGEERTNLEALARELGIQSDTYLPGFVENPFKYLARADVFVLSSLWEDPGHVLMEAAYLRVPIVSSDCPSGPRDFLEDGKLGALVPMGDAAAMANAIGRLLDSEKPLAAIEAARKKAAGYSIPRSVRSYLDVFEGIP